MTNGPNYDFLLYFVVAFGVVEEVFECRHKGKYTDREFVHKNG